MRQIILVAHNIRSSHNVGSLLRTADGLGIKKVILSGYTPYPKQESDTRLPHLSDRLSKQIHKTALGSENTVDWQHTDNLKIEIAKLRKAGYKILALEQTNKSLEIASYKPNDKIVLLVGNELTGLEVEVLNLVNDCLEIPMLGSKESFNVAVAAAMALFYFIYA